MESLQSATGQLHHHNLRQGLQGNLCFATGAPPPLFPSLTWVSQTCFSHVSLTPHCCAALFSRRCHNHGSQCRDGWVGASWNCLSLTGDSPRLSSQKPPLYPPLPMSGHLHHTHCASDSVPHTSGNLRI